MKFILSLSLLILWTNSLAEDQIEIAAKLLSLDFAPFVMTSKREIVVYNYRKREMLKLSDSPKSLRSDSPEAIAYAKEWTNTIKEFTPQETGYLGWGFYTTNNPVSSQDFANDEEVFALVTQKYKDGANFLDIRSLPDQNSFPISKETIKYINKICYLPTASPNQKISNGPHSYHTFTKHYIGRNENCNKVFVKALDNLKIDGILYEWKDEDFNFCDAKKTNAAFINVNGEISNQTVELIVNPSEEIKAEAKLISEGKKKAKDFSLGQSTYEAYQKVAVFMNAMPLEQTIYGKKLENFEPKDQKQKDKIIERIKKEAFGCDIKYEQDDAPFFDANNAALLAIKEGLTNLKEPSINGMNKCSM